MTMMEEGTTEDKPKMGLGSKPTPPPLGTKESLTFDEYERMARVTHNSNLTSQDLLIYNTLKIAGESGEVADHVGKAFGQGHSISTPHLVEELGDILWHISDLCYALGIPLEEVARQNNKKLAMRYPRGFTTKDSLNRKGEENGQE